MGFFGCDHTWERESRYVRGSWCLIGHNDDVLIHEHRCTKCGKTEKCNFQGEYVHGGDNGRDTRGCSVCKGT